MSGFRFVYVTCKDAEQARSMARTLLDRKLIACANILPQMESVYRWKGEVQNDREAVLILKTSDDRVELAIKAVEELHTYETPCALSFSIDKGSKGYLAWLTNELT